MPWLMAAVYDHVMRATEEACLSTWRAELLSGASGSVLELGAGTGANLPYYPVSATHVTLLEPDPHMRARLGLALQRRPDRDRFEIASADATALPFAAESYDTVVSTLVLCSVADLRRTLEEIARVLRPEGQLLYLEHVAAPSGSWLLSVQRSLEPLWKRIAGGCHLTRATLAAIERAGLVPMFPRSEELRRAPPWIRPSVRGRAIKPSASA